MLYVNGTKLDVTNTKDPAVQFYLSKKKVIEQQKGLFVVRQVRSDSKSPHYYDELGRRLLPVPVTIPSRWGHNSERGFETWRYVESADPYDVGKFRYEPKAFFVSDQMEFSYIDDVEKIFYIQYIVTEKGLGQCGLYIDDPVKKATKRINQEAGNELDVRYMVFRNKEITEEALRRIAIGWNIGDAATLNLEVLRTKLFDKVIEDHKRNPQDEAVLKRFLKDCELGEELETKVLINKAVHKGTIFDFNQPTLRWHYKGGDYICQVPPDKLMDKNLYLANHFMRSDKFSELQALRIEVGEENTKPTYSQVDIDKLDTVDDCRKVAKELGLVLPFHFKDPVKARKWLIEHVALV